MRSAFAIVSILIAVLLHVFYVDYAIGIDDPDTRGFLFSWIASPAQRAAYIDNLARQKMKPERKRVIQIPSEDQIANLRWHHMNDYCTWRGRGRKGSSSLDFSGMKCSKEFLPPPVTWKSLTIPAVGLEQARREIEADVRDRSIQFGIVPSTDTAGSEEPSRSAMERSYWLGIVVPVGLAFLSLALLLMRFRTARAAA